MRITEAEIDRIRELALEGYGKIRIAEMMGRVPVIIGMHAQRHGIAIPARTRGHLRRKRKRTGHGIASMSRHAANHLGR